MKSARWLSNTKLCKIGAMVEDTGQLQFGARRQMVTSFSLCTIATSIAELMKTRRGKETVVLTSRFSSMMRSSRELTVSAPRIFTLEEVINMRTRLLECMNIALLHKMRICDSEQVVGCVSEFEFTAMKYGS